MYIIFADRMHSVTCWFICMHW